MSEVEVVSEISPTARLAPDVKVGQYCSIGPQVVIGPRTVLGRRVCITGRTVIGADNVIEDGCVLGDLPQDLKYAGGATLLIVGDRNKLCRRVTAHPGTEMGGFLTRIGNDNVLDDCCHVAHDCYVDDRTYLGRSVMLAGHVRVNCGAMVEELSGAHHFTTIGEYACVKHGTPVRRDVPPFTVYGKRDSGKGAPAVTGINKKGISAAKMGRGEKRELRRALHELFDDEAALETKIEQLVSLGVEGRAAELCKFIQRSLQGVYGRSRERFRGQAPPEAAQYLPPEYHKLIGRRSR